MTNLLELLMGIQEMNLFLQKLIAQLPGAVEYTDCFSAKG